jgi:hypothetical protein
MDACHAATACSGDKLFPSGLEITESIHSEKEKGEEVSEVEGVGTAPTTETRLLAAKAGTINLISDMRDGQSSDFECRRDREGRTEYLPACFYTTNSLPAVVVNPPS